MNLADLRRAALQALRPPPRLRLSEWLEREVRLPEGTSALPGPLRLWPYQREIADAIGDPTIERVTVVKPVRVGFTTLLTGAVASFVANDPAPILRLLPTESDCRDYTVSEIEPLFAATPAVAGMLADDQREGDRNTLLSRRFAGGSLKVVAARAPRNLRRHTARVLLIDEADAMDVGPEGSPILLAERRTLSYADRKIVLGSTPLLEETSHVLRAYAASDQRVFEVPCPACGAFAEITWAMIEWEPERPDTAAFRCPTCHTLVPETAKPAMVTAARWRATRPEVKGHAGFRLNALVSGLVNASWGRLAAEFLVAKEDTEELRVFVNTILAQGWRDVGDEIDDTLVATRVEPFSLDAMPPEVLVLTCGVDVQDDRLEVSIVGWAKDGTAFVLGHLVLFGPVGEDAVWQQLDEVLRSRWTHPKGSSLGIDATCVDSGDNTARVYAYAFARAGRRLWACKGLPGSRPLAELSQHRVRTQGSGRLVLVGADTAKGLILDKLARGRGLRFSDTLTPIYFEQLCSERRIIRYTRGVPVRRWERKPGMRAEALDALVYAHAARQLVHVPLDAREAALCDGSPATPSPAASVPSPWVGAW